MLTRSLVLAAALMAAASAASAASASALAAPDFDPILINHPAYTQVAERRLQSAPSGLRQSAPVWTQPQYNRRVPGNAGDTSYGGDWAETWGGGP
jgi:hypothetical protein